MGSFRGVCTLQQQQVGRTDLELATLCTPMRTMLAYFRMTVLWGSLAAVSGEYQGHFARYHKATGELG